MSSDGELIGEIYEERRTVVPRDKIPPVMIHAIVDAEDAQFYEHGGISYYGIFRALLDDLKPGAHVRGASTLTQQLVRNLILKNFARSGFAGIKRKVQEMILAKRLESKLSKDEILYLYLNQIDFPYQRYRRGGGGALLLRQVDQRRRRRRGGAAGVAAQGAERDRSVEASRSRQGAAALRVVADGALQPSVARGRAPICQRADSAGEAVGDGGGDGARVRRRGQKGARREVRRQAAGDARHHGGDDVRRAHPEAGARRGGEGARRSRRAAGLSQAAGASEDAAADPGAREEAGEGVSGGAVARQDRRGRDHRDHRRQGRPPARKAPSSSRSARRGGRRRASGRARRRLRRRLRRPRRRRLRRCRRRA